MRLLERLHEFLPLLGMPGLFLLAFVDSAAIPIAGGPEAATLLLSLQHPERLWMVAAAATIGSLLGCFVLYRIGRAGGELALGRFSEARRLWIRRKLDSHAFWTVLVSELVPPPFPNKLVTLAAGVFHMRLGEFSVGVLLGRSIRYGLTAYLGAQLGRQTVAADVANSPLILLAIAGAILLACAVHRFLRKPA
ncbi:MAG TPA: VTT domain-containing protein [Acidobacteriota bacterium]|nr:VTT domain-containing protein [Acidobacteriota bacterium]